MCRLVSTSLESARSSRHRTRLSPGLARKFTDFSESRGIQSQPVEVAVGEASQEVRLLVDQEAVLPIQLP
jgi:hypothetical protein